MEFEQSLRIVLENTAVLNPVKTYVPDAVGCVLSEDVYSTIDMPPFDKSAMDGYAIKSNEVRNIPALLKCAGIIEAGKTFHGKLKNGECAKIMTGAPMPDGADCVIMVEDSKECDGMVEILKPGKQWENVCFRGEDINKGQRVITKGTKISVSHVSLLASLGRKFVKVARKPRVAVINTGGEIVQPGNPITKGQIYNSNGPQLISLLNADGILPRFLGIVPDKPEQLKNALKKGLDYDMLLISGGVSMGDYDLVPSILTGLGVRKCFHKVNIKPGKPLFFGRKTKRLVFGIPGNPVSNFLIYMLFIRSAIRKMTGLKDPAPCFEKGVLEKDFSQKTGRKHFVLSKLTVKNDYYHVTPLESHGSADIMALSKADAFMIAEEDVSSLNAGSIVNFLRWK